MIEVAGWPGAAGPTDIRATTGDVILLTGPNGCGKTSLLRGLAGLAAPMAARSVRVNGDDPAEVPADMLARQVGWVPQDPRDALVGLTVAGEFRVRSRRRPPALPLPAERTITGLSSGEARRLALALADGRLLLLDEPAEGLDEQSIVALRGRILAHKARGVVVLADHTGRLHGTATREVRLGSTAPPARAEPIVGTGEPIRIGGGTIPWTGAHVPDLRLHPGLHLVRGPNGVGKSTLLWCLAGLQEGPHASRRDVVLDAPHGVAMLPCPAHDMWVTETVGDELGGCDATAAALVPVSLRARSVFALSGGEAQRVALARVLAQPADLLLLDEPEAHLDAAARAGLLDLLRQRVAAGCVVIIASHDEMWPDLCMSVVELRRP